MTATTEASNSLENAGFIAKLEQAAQESE